MSAGLYSKPTYADSITSFNVIETEGKTAKVGTPTVLVTRADPFGNVLEAFFAGNPTGADAGYATGCLFFNTNGGTGATCWVNQGTATSAIWFDMDTVGGGSGGGLSIPYSENDSITTTGTSASITSSAITTGSVYGGTVTTANFTTGGSVFNANLNAAVAGQAFNATTTGAYTGTGLLVLTANSAATGTVATISATGLTSGVGLKISGGSSMTTAGSLFTGAITGANGSTFDVTCTGVYVDTTGLTSIIANSLTTGSLEVASATGQTTGVLYSITGGGANLAAGGIILDLEMGAATAGQGLKVLTSGVYAGSNNLALFSANSATTTTGIVSITGTGLTSGVGLLVTAGGANMTSGIGISVAMGAATAGNGIAVSSTGVYATGSSGLINVTANSATTTTGLVQVSSTGLTTGSAVLVTLSGATLASGGKGVEIAMGAATTGNGLTVTSTGTYTAAAGNALVNVVANSATTAGGLVQISGTGLTSGQALNITGGGANITSLAATMNLSMGASTTGVGLKISSTGTYVGTAGNGLLNLTANSATTTAGIAQISVTGLTTGTALLITAAAATLTTGFYFAVNDGALNCVTIGANGHFATAQTTAPTIAVGTQNGITAAAITAGSTDSNGIITTTGTSTGGTVFTVTFNKTYTTAPKTVMLTPANAAAATAGVSLTPGAYVSSTTATTFVVTIPNASGATPSFYYDVVG